MSKRVCILGTAPSWSKAPFDDPSIAIWGINDGYMSRTPDGRGVPRADAWWELHPLDHFYYRKPEQRVVYAEQVPPGYYVRPEGHLEWLKEQARTIPVYLQDHPPADWSANARRFDIERAEAVFGKYWSSGPAYMVAQAILDDSEEIHIYGIHLSTQQEYIDQRPGFEHLLGIARGRGIKVVMADESPVLKHPWRYAYESRPTPTVNPALVALHQELKAAQKRHEELVQQLVMWPRFKDKSKAQDELRRVQVVVMDVQQRLAMLQPHGTVTALVVAA